MNTKNAKDFLVNQAVEQAVVDRVPLSDIEKRMMYFVENDPLSCNDPMQLSEEFEAQCDTAQYELKMSRLLDHAYKRIKEGDPEGMRNWQEAMSLLSNGDHYLPVLWKHGNSEHPLRGFGVGLLIALGIGIIIIVWAWVHPT